MAYQGKFKPNNPKKYNGDPTNIIYRSRWESRFMSYLDSHADVISWSSEEIVVPYKSPIDNRVHRYFVDFWVKIKRADGTIKESLIEIKPFKETQEPRPNKNRNRYITEVKTYVINKAKWQFAEAFCEARGWDFQIVTEKELGLNH
jgi:hypothetical protein